ncbi:MAG: polyprenyl diphosphate synthase [bacterium]
MISGLGENILPSHVAFIMDGNRRWAKKHSLATELGHKEGYQRFKEIIDKSFELGVRTVTVYAFSTENWNRSDDEVSGIMNLARYVIKNDIASYKKRNVKVNIIGETDMLPVDIQEQIATIESETEKKNSNVINIAFSYGSRSEIVRAACIAADNNLEITEESIGANLYTGGQTDPDLIIRTGGQPRLSNFLLWQAAYSEIYFTDSLWPDFDVKELMKSFEFYSKIKRNFGK